METAFPGHRPENYFGGNGLIRAKMTMRMTDWLRCLVAAGIIMLNTVSLAIEPIFSTQQPVTDSVAAESVPEWRADLAYLSDKIVQLHPDPFFATDEVQFNALRDWIDTHIPVMNRSRIILSFMRLLALVGVQGHDGHSGLWPYQAPADFHLYPLRLYWFEDGLYVVDAEPDRSLVGARLESINGHQIDDILTVVDPFISRDGPMWVRTWAPIHILSPEFQNALGFGTDNGSAQFGVTKDGEQRSVTLQSMAHADYHNRFPTVLWTGALPAAEQPRYLHRDDDYYWFEEWPDSRTLYFQYNATTRENNAGKSLKRVITGLSEIVRSGRVDRLVVDARSNGGGDNTTYGNLLDFLEKDPFFQEPGRLYIIIGRITFSAGSNFITDAEQQTDAVFVGEPTGGSPNQYGDAEQIDLPNSGIRARVSTRYWNKAGKDDQRLHHESQLSAPPTAADYFQEHDAAVEIILRDQPTIEKLQ